MKHNSWRQSKASEDSRNGLIESRATPQQQFAEQRTDGIQRTRYVTTPWRR